MAPDLVSGSEQEHLPLVGFTSWIWGLFATGFVLLAATAGRAMAPNAGLAYAAVVGGAWIVAATLAILGPSFVTGTDPTSIPIAGLVAPIGALVATGYATVLVAATTEADPRAARPPFPAG